MRRAEALEKIVEILRDLDEHDMNIVYEWLRTGWPESIPQAFGDRPEPGFRGPAYDEPI